MITLNFFLKVYAWLEYSKQNWFQYLKNSIVVSIIVVMFVIGFVVGCCVGASKWLAWCNKMI